MATLRITSGPAQGRTIECDRELLFGREGVDVVIDDDEMSRRHAAIRPGPGGTEVEDLGSLNGTFVDGGRITGTVVLTHSATIRMGKSEVALVLAPNEVSAAEGAGGKSDIVVGEMTVARDRPVFDVQDRTVARAQPVADVPDRTVARPEPVADVPDRTVARSEPIAEVTDRTVARDKPIFDVAEKTTIRTVPPLQPPSAPPPSSAPPAPPAGSAPAAGTPPAALPGADLPGVGLPGVGLPGVGAPGGAGAGEARRRPARGQGLPPRAKIILPILLVVIVAVVLYLLLH